MEADDTGRLDGDLAVPPRRRATDLAERPAGGHLLGWVAAIGICVAALGLLVTAAFTYFTYDRGRQVNVVACGLQVQGDNIVARSDNDVAVDLALEALVDDDQQALAIYRDGIAITRHNVRVTRAAVAALVDTCSDGEYEPPSDLRTIPGYILEDGP